MSREGAFWDGEEVPEPHGAGHERACRGCLGRLENNPAMAGPRRGRGRVRCVPEHGAASARVEVELNSVEAARWRTGWCTQARLAPRWHLLDRARAGFPARPGAGARGSGPWDTVDPQALAGRLNAEATTDCAPVPADVPAPVDAPMADPVAQ